MKTLDAFFILLRGKAWEKLSRGRSTRHIARTVDTSHHYFSLVSRNETPIL